MALPSGNNSAAAAPTGGAGAPSGGMSSTPLVRNETFLRGGYYTNDAGIVEITTLYAGYYAGRTPHVHTMVHVDWEQAENG
jgi:protocatechuate 3,4-dioxygenase beta subunit